MKRLMMVLCVATLTAVAQAPDKTAKAPTKAAAAASLSEIETSFDKKEEAAVKAVKTERLAALEAFVGDKKNAERADLNKGRLAAAELAAELENWSVSRKQADALVAAATDEKSAPMRSRGLFLAAQAQSKSGAPAETVKKLFMDLIEAAEIEKPHTLQTAYASTQAASEFLTDLGDKAGVEKVWETLTDKIPDEQLAEIAQAEVDKVKLIGEAPKAFPAEAKDLAGKPLALSDYAGKVVLIDFWATWCGPCVGEIPHLVETYAKFKDKGFEIVGISLDDEDDAKTLPEYLSDKGMTWRQFADGAGWKNEIATLYGVRSIPATYLLDRAGKVHRVGLRGAALTKAIEKLLAAPSK